MDTNTMKPLKIISLPVDKGGCGWYRIRQPFEMINEFTDSEAHVIENDKDDELYMVKALTVADVVVIRQGGEAAIRLFKEIPEFKHLKYVLDIDDNIELISPYSEHYKEYGTQEFTDQNGVAIWKRGVHDFYPEKNAHRIMSLMTGLMEADLVTCTTEKLAEYAGQYNKHVAVLPNSVNLKHWWKLPLIPNTQLRVGWSGGISHYEDWYSIKEPLNALMKKYQFKLIMAGSHFSGVVDEENKHLVEVYPWVPFEAHSYRTMCLNLDIAIIPLADLPFNHYKSSIKFHEFSAMKVPCLVSNILPYFADITPGLNALGYKTPEQFVEGLELLLNDQGLSQRLANIAYLAVKDDYNAEKNAHLWTDAYGSIL